jgi:hypothetical protein
MYIIKYVVFDYLPDENKFPYNIASRMVKTRQNQDIFEANTAKM